ncbi:MAG TPA: hypothetical protein PLM24_02590 [Methanothrix sp.]|nr:hypothetical protein [Methanothrix sp.]HPJ84971.1 hypothetical protein [Methanothrix sp.]HPR66006.1 hypothetical protein [Methanothrix sp.]
MRLKVIILVSMVAICGAADALEFVQEISVEGNGGLSARTTTDAAKDAINGTGEQEYVRNLNLQESATNLRSEYHLISNLQEKTNRYYAQMNSPSGLEHFISVDSASNIDSVSTITQSEYVVSTDYDITAKMAEMSERITSWDDSDDGKTGNKIAETETSGNFSVKSQLTDDGGMVDKPTGFSPAEMLEMLESVEIIGEFPVLGEEDEDIFVGEVVSEVEAEVEKGFIPLGSRSELFRSEDVSKRSIVILGGYRSRT